MVGVIDTVHRENNKNNERIDSNAHKDECHQKVK